MTEAKWLAATDPAKMLQFLHRTVSERKLRLFICGCARLLPESFFSDEIAQSIRYCELFADGEITLQDTNLLRSRKQMRIYCPTPENFHRLLLSSNKMLWVAVHHQIALTVNSRVEVVLGKYQPENRKAWKVLSKQERSHITTFVRDIFDNPFRPITLDPSWLTSTVLALANCIYNDKAFDRMPILADALQDAACDNEDILNHCRQPGEHTRGCFVVDLLLQKI